MLLRGCDECCCDECFCAVLLILPTRTHTSTLPSHPHHRLQFAIKVLPECVLELDSTTPLKWSRHLVVHLPGAAFASNAHAGRFVKQILQHPQVGATVMNPADT